MRVVLGRRRAAVSGEGDNSPVPVPVPVPGTGSEQDRGPAHDVARGTSAPAPTLAESAVGASDIRVR